jgi:hypothetical protein
MNPFAKYRYINAEEIIKANIRPNHVCIIEYQQKKNILFFPID